MLELVRQLALTIESPVWEAVRAPAPWKIKSPLPPFVKGGNTIEKVSHG
jgi:nitrogenase molybdenum-cofactor synthesis protein NifE